jgi:murein DD-endopeptidase MepM/ murein hydrolase activator NlpD
MSRLSVHFNDSGNKTGFGEFLHTTFEAKSPIKIIYSVNGNIKPDIIKYSPSTLLIYRRQTETFNRLPNNFFMDDPVQDATDWLLNTKDPTDQNRSQLENWLLNPADYYDPLNEPSIELADPNNPEQVAEAIRRAKYLNTWELTALEIAHQHGLKLVLFSFGTESGTLDLRVWNELIPCLTKGKEYGAILSLHAYGLTGDLINRPGAYKQHLNIYKLLPESLHLPVVYSECGAGNGYDTGLSGQAFVDDLGLVDDYWRTDKLVLGGCAFQLGGQESNMVDVLPELGEYIKTHPDEEGEDMKLNYVVIGYLAPQNATIEQVKQIQEDAFPTRSTVSQSADDVRALVSMGLPGSKAIIYEPQTWPGGIDGITQYFIGLSIEFRYFGGQSVDFWVQSPILDIPFRVTDPFNAPRSYANGKHEGLDLDCYDDINRRAVNIYAGQIGTVESVVTIWSGTSYGKHVIIKHNWYGQVFKTWYCHLSSVSVIEGQTVRIGEKIGVGGNTGTTAIHLHFMIQWIGHGLSSYFTLDVVDPLPLIRKPSSTQYLTKSGVGMASQSILSNTELLAITKSKVSTTLVLTLPDYEDTKTMVTQLKILNQEIIGRLFFSANIGSKFTPQEFLNYCGNGLTGLYDSGVRVFQIHNEPNLESEGNGWNWVNGYEFGIWLKGIITLLKTKYSDIKLIYPGLSPQPNTVQFFKDSKFAADLCDYVGVHSYWHTVQNGQWNMIDRSGGMSWKDVADLTTKDIIVTEYSNNNPNETYENKGLQYKQYIELLKQDGRVVSAYSFALNWPNQDVNREGWVYNGSLTAIPEKLGI